MAAGGGGDADADEAADHQREHGELLGGEDAGGPGLTPTRRNSGPRSSRPMTSSSMMPAMNPKAATATQHSPRCQSSTMRRTPGGLGAGPPGGQSLWKALIQPSPTLLQRAGEFLSRRLQHLRTVLAMTRRAPGYAQYRGHVPSPRFRLRCSAGSPLAGEGRGEGQRNAPTSA